MSRRCIRPDRRGAFSARLSAVELASSPGAGRPPRGHSRPRDRVLGTARTGAVWSRKSHLVLILNSHAPLQKKRKKKKGKKKEGWEEGKEGSQIEMSLTNLRDVFSDARCDVRS